MNNFLAIDCSSHYLAVLAQKGDKKVLRHVENCATKHSEILMGEIQAALDGVNLKPADCDFFAAVTGPGSFTGIRIGIAAAKGLAFGTGKPTLGVTSFELIAYNVNSENFYTVIDAAHGHYYVCGWRCGKVALEPCYMSREEVEKLAPLYGFENLSFENYTRLNAAECLDKAVNGKKRSEPFGEICALYVRKSQAEEGRK